MAVVGGPEMEAEAEDEPEMEAEGGAEIRIRPGPDPSVWLEKKPESYDLYKDCKVVFENPNLVATTTNAPALGLHNRILHFIICQVLQIRKGSYTVATKHDVWWMAKIMREDPPDLCASIFGRIREGLANAQTTDPKPYLPYGKLITRIIERKLNNHINPKEPFATSKEVMNPLNSLGLLGWKIDPETGEPRKKNEASASEAALDPHMEEIRGMFASMSTVITDMSTMFSGRLDTVDRHHQVQEAQNLHNHENIEAVRRGETYSIPFPTYESFFPPPPQDP